MRRVKYPDDKRNLESEYCALFTGNLAEMQIAWAPLRDVMRRLSNAVDKNSLYPDEIKDYLCMTYNKLVDVYLDYYVCMGTNNNPKDKDTHVKLQKLFHYSGVKDAVIPAMQPSIAQFFMSHADDLGVHVCHYCETSYVNAYGMSGVYSDVAQFLFSASEGRIRHYIRASNGGELADATIKRIMKLREESNIDTIVDAFDSMGAWHAPVEKKSETLTNKLKNHFDLDHFLPKSECPMVGLSLYNFVPSCSVCNEKLKGADRIGALDRSRLLKLSPTSSHYDLDSNLFVSIIPKTGVSLSDTQSHPEDYRLEFLPSNNDYQEVVDEFCLEERYNYHKPLALRYFDRYKDYSPAVIKMFAKVLNGAKTELEIEEDIFGDKFSKNNNRCFEKLKQDIRKQSGR